MLAADEDTRLRLQASKYLSNLDVKLFSLHARIAPPESDGCCIHDEILRSESMHAYGRPPEELTEEEVSVLIAEGFREHVERRRAAGRLAKFLEQAGVMDGTGGRGDEGNGGWGEGERGLWAGAKNISEQERGWAAADDRGK